ncbi:MAG: glycosyltransferase family 9 protein [Nanoarchaeota archaeon]|nr:glycosyltransferase family 9 protein [Nanoarchaeota archaeon]
MNKIDKILVIKNDKIGDMILSTNIFRELRKNYPKARISVIASNSNKPLIEKNKNINDIIVLDYPPKIFKDYLNYFNFAKKIRKEKFDIGIDLRGSFYNIFFLLFLGGVKYRIGFYNKFFSKFLLNYSYKKDRINKHVTFQRIDLINKALGTNSKNYWPEIAFDKNDELEVNYFIKRNKLKKWICILPDSSVEDRQWALDKWDATIKHLLRRYSGYKILILGMDKKKINYLLKRNSSVIYPEKPLNLRIVYLLLRKSSLVIAQDGGPMHLAWTGNSKLIALISGYIKRPEYFNKLKYMGPLGKKSLVIYKDMKNITLEDVKEKIDYFL